MCVYITQMVFPFYKTFSHIKELGHKRTKNTRPGLDRHGVSAFAYYDRTRCFVCKNSPSRKVGRQGVSKSHLNNTSGEIQDSWKKHKSLTMYNTTTHITQVTSQIRMSQTAKEPLSLYRLRESAVRSATPACAALPPAPQSMNQ